MKTRRWQIGAITIAVLASLLAWLGGPRPTQLGPQTTGDVALAASVRAMVADPAGYRGLAVAVVENGAIRFAGLGSSGDEAGHPVHADTAFEIGSVAKALTGMLLADMARDGTVRVDEPLRAVLPAVKFTDPDVAETTLAELASHRSGLPRIRLTGVAQALGMNLRQLRAQDPYAGQDTAWLLSTVGSATAGSGKSTVNYSNYGMAVLGHALASRAGIPYPELLKRRILDPLGMTDSGFHLDGAAPPPGSARGATASGRVVDPWTASGYAPAGSGVWSTAGDLTRLVTAMLARTASGEDAATPRFDEDAESKVGYGWFTRLWQGRELTWHNGGTGGFRSFVGFDRAAGRGVVVLGNTDRSVDELGLRLLDGPRRDGDGPGLALIAVTVFFGLVGGLGLLTTALRAGVDRLTLVSNGVWAVTTLMLAYAVGAWLVVPTWVWAVSVGLSAYATALAARRWRGAPLHRGRRAWLSWCGTAVSTALAGIGLAWVWI